MRVRNERANIQNVSCVGRENVIFFLGADIEKGREAGTKIAENIATTPPSLLGIDRRIV